MEPIVASQSPRHKISVTMVHPMIRYIIISAVFEHTMEERETRLELVAFSADVVEHETRNAGEIEVEVNVELLMTTSFCVREISFVVFLLFFFFFCRKCPLLTFGGIWMLLLTDKSKRGLLYMVI